MTTADRYRRLSALFEETISAASGWDGQSPCAEWTAREVLDHVISSELAVLNNVDLTVERTVDAGDDPAGAWRELSSGVQAILDDPQRAGLSYESLGATTAISESIDKFLCFDLIVHRWDIARATGLAIDIPEQDIDDANTFLDAMGSMFHEYGAGAPPVEVDADATAQDRLIARSGRDPQWSVA